MADRFVIIDFQWYTLSGERVVPKELASCDNNFRRSHFVFKPVLNFGSLSSTDQRTARYVYNYHHCLPWDGGNTSLGEFDDIIKFLCFNMEKIYVKGKEKANYIKAIVNKPVIELEHAGRIKRDKPSCMFHVGNYCVCALTNVENLYNFLSGN
ncbi:hypothetical protein QE152_g4562 [Popillia japonica]|uniref:Uncharacterized protein n=1 Tax=Popillia japonica TaxID=7064 RepID=A0AAW1N0H8_POPJA